MSDDAQTIMTIFALDTAGAHCGMCGAKVCPHTAQGVTELIRMANDPPPERAILTELIAELRDAEGDSQAALWGIADRAEARLKELGGNDV